MTPLMTLIFAFHYVIRGLMTPTKTPTPTPSQVKTSLKYLLLFTFQWLSESSKALTKWSNFTNVIMDETVSLLSKGFFKVGHIRWICTLVMQFYLDYWWNCKQFCLHLKPTPYCRWLPWNLLQIWEQFIIYGDDWVRKSGITFLFFPSACHSIISKFHSLSWFILKFFKAR